MYTLRFKSLESVRFFCFNEINPFIKQGGIKLIKSESKEIYNVTNDLKKMKNEKKKKWSLFPQKY